MSEQEFTRRGGQEWTCKDGVVYFATHKGWPMRYGAHAREVVDAHKAALAAAVEANNKWWRERTSSERVLKLEQQLTTERENAITAERYAIKLEHQLTAERETSRYWKEQWVERGAQLAAAKGALHHMEACRALLGVPDDEVLYQAIKDEREKVRVLVETLEDAPCTCFNPDGSYPHDPKNPDCYRIIATDALAKVNLTTNKKGGDN